MQKLWNDFADYHTIDLLRLSQNGEQRSHLDGEEMQELIVELANRLESMWHNQMEQKDASAY